MNYMQQPMQNPEDISDPTTTMNMTLVLMAKAIQMVGENGGNQFRLYARQNAWNQIGYNAGQHNRLIVVSGTTNQNGNGNFVVARVEGNGNRNNSNQIRCYNCREVGHYARNCIVWPRRRDAAYLQT
ncbi:reverse transcriptase domain-containing protein [Tanacetum coccineum]